MFTKKTVKQTAPLAALALGGLLAFACSDSNSGGVPGIPAVGNSTTGMMLATTADATVEVTISGSGNIMPVALAQDLVGDPAVGGIPYTDPTAWSTSCEKDTLAPAYVDNLPSTISATSVWTDSVGVANCTVGLVDGYSVNGMDITGSWNATLSGLINGTTATGFAYADESVTGVVSGYEVATLNSFPDDYKDEDAMSMVAGVAYTGGNPEAGTLNGFMWERSRHHNNWIDATTVTDPGADTLGAVTFNGFMWATSVGAGQTFNGSYKVDTEDGYYTVTAANVTQGFDCAASANVPDGGTITISNGTAADEIVLDMTAIDYTVAANCGDADVSFGGAAAYTSTVFSGPVFQ